MRVASREMRVQIARSGLQIMRCGMRVAIVKCRGIGESLAYLCNSFVLTGIDFIFGMVLV